MLCLLHPDARLLRDALLKVFNTCAEDGKDMAVCLDSGSSRAATKINQILGKMKRPDCQLAGWQLLPSQQLLEQRAHFLSAQSLGQIRVRLAGYSGHPSAAETKGRWL